MLEQQKPPEFLHYNGIPWVPFKETIILFSYPWHIYFATRLSCTSSSPTPISFSFPHPPPLATTCLFFYDYDETNSLGWLTNGSSGCFQGRVSEKFLAMARQAENKIKDSRGY